MSEGVLLTLITLGAGFIASMFWTAATNPELYKDVFSPLLFRIGTLGAVFALGWQFGQFFRSDTWPQVAVALALVMIVGAVSLDVIASGSAKRAREKDRDREGKDRNRLE
jgi:hypothetical protein